MRNTFSSPELSGVVMTGLSGAVSAVLRNGLRLFIALIPMIFSSRRMKRSSMSSGNSMSESIQSMCVTPCPIARWARTWRPNGRIDTPYELTVSASRFSGALRHVRSIMWARLIAKPVWHISCAGQRIATRRFSTLIGGSFGFFVQRRRLLMRPHVPISPRTRRGSVCIDPSTWRLF